MTRRVILGLALCSSFALASNLMAQGPGGGGGRGGFPGMGGPGGFTMPPIMLLGAKEVQDELKLDDKQIAEIEKLRAEAMPQRGRRGAQPTDPQAAPDAAATQNGQAGGGAPVAKAEAPGAGSRRGGQNGQGAAGKQAAPGTAAQAQAGGQNGQDPNAAQPGGQNGQGGGGGQGGPPPDFAAMRERMQQAMQDAETKLAKILKPAQRTRLQQIALQMEGPFAIANKPEIANRLKVSEEQQEQIAMVLEEYQTGSRQLGETRRALFTEMRDNGGFQRGTPLPKEMQTKMDSMQKETETFKTQAEKEIVKVLNKTQRAAWQRGLGAPFDTKSISFGGRGGRGGPGGRGGNNGGAPADATAKDATPKAAAAAIPKATDPATTPAKKSLRDRRGGAATAPSSADNP